MGNGTLTQVCSLSNHSLSPSLTVFQPGKSKKQYAKIPFYVLQPRKKKTPKNHDSTQWKALHNCWLGKMSTTGLVVKCQLHSFANHPYKFTQTGECWNIYHEFKLQNNLAKQIRSFSSAFHEFRAWCKNSVHSVFISNNNQMLLTGVC